MRCRALGPIKSIEPSSWQNNRENHNRWVVGRIEKIIALAMVDKGFWEPGTRFKVQSSDGLSRNGVISKLPMYDRIR